MKKFIAMVAVFATLAVSATAQKINVASYEAKLAKCNADIANPKKAGKAETWFNSGKVCSDAITAPTKSLFSGLDESMLQMTIGAPANESKDGVHKFDFITVYAKNGKVVAWTIDKEVLEGA